MKLASRLDHKRAFPEPKDSENVSPNRSCSYSKKIRTKKCEMTASSKGTKVKSKRKHTESQTEGN